MGKFKKSLAEWMIDNLGKDSIEKYWSDMNDINPWSIGYGSRGKVWVICQEKDYHGHYEVNPYKFTKGSRCPYCRGFKVHPKDSFAQWGIDNLGEDFLDKYWDYDLNKTINPWNTTISTAKKIYIKCQNKSYHESYPVCVHHYTGDDSNRCPYCSMKSGKVHRIDSLGSIRAEAIPLWSNKNIKSAFEYSPKSNKKVYWKCENGIHEDYERSVNKSNCHDFRCPQCSSQRGESLLQEKIRLFLTNELNYIVKHEYNCNITCINPNTSYILPYDNEVIINANNRLIIEVHGKQHYDINEFILASSKKNGNSAKEELEYIQWKDKFKKDFAISQGYYYLAIPYWTDNGQKEWKKLILEKINKISE